MVTWSPQDGDKDGESSEVTISENSFAFFPFGRVA